MISDNGKIYIDRKTKQQMITYVAIPAQIPGVYQETLKQLGKNCIASRDTGSYIKCCDELEYYERKLREMFGQLVTREVFKSKAYEGEDA